MQLTTLGLTTDVMVLGLSGSTIEDQDEWLVVRTPSNPDFWWGNFLCLPGPVQPGTGRTWSGRSTDAFPGAGHLAFAVDSPSGRAGEAADLADMGVEAELDTVLTASAVSGLVPLPASAREAASIRALTGDQDWSQALSLRSACDDMPSSPEQRTYLARRVAAERAMAEAGHGTRFGAFADGRLVAALGIVGDGRGLARFQVVETHPDHRRRGLARALLHHAAEHAAATMSAHTLVVVADPDHHAVELYRSAGFTESQVQTRLGRAGS